MIGKVKTLTDKGFGFIQIPGQRKDLFFHSKSLDGVAFDDLQVGDELVFDVEEGDKGPFATNVGRSMEEA